MKKLRQKRLGVSQNCTDFIETISSIGNGKYDLREVWQAFVMLNAIALSNLVDEKNALERTRLYNEIAKKFTQEEVALLHHLLDITAIELGKKPDQDFLGGVFMSMRLGNKWIGQDFTPYSICKITADISCSNAVSVIERKGIYSIGDPACGACATLIAGVNCIAASLKKSHPELLWNDHIIVIGQDIDPIAGLMGYIQLSILGCAGFIKIGDTLSDPISAEEDDFSKYWYMPWYGYHCIDWLKKQADDTQA